jgi:hypothetical protein
MAGVVISNQILSGGQSQKIVTSTTAAQSTALTGVSQVTLVCDVNTFVRMGPSGSTTALSTGVDQLLLANQQYRIIPIISGYVLSFVLASGTGNVYLTPEA